MPRFNVAHLREQGQDMLLFALEGSSFHHVSESQQSEIVAELQLRANRAGLAGRAAAFWNYGSSGYFRGPSPWHPFLRSIDISWVSSHANRAISW